MRTSHVMIAETGPAQDARTALLMEVPHHVALADNPVDRMAIAADDDGTDPVLGEEGQ